MTREELLQLVNGKVDTTKFNSLSKKSIEEELDDVLEDFGDDSDKNDKIVDKLANRLKRMDGNLHKNVSEEMKKNREAEEERKRLEEEKKRNGKDSKGEGAGGDGSEKNLEDKVNDLLKKIETMESERAESERKQAKAALLESVKNGLKDKFEKAGLSLNGFFVKTAMAKLEVPDKDADVSALIDEAEKLYNADAKEAGLTPSTKPRNGGGEGSGGDVTDHAFDDIKALAARNKPATSSDQDK